MPDDLQAKLGFLKERGFRTIWERDIFFQPELRVCFSLEYLEDHSLDEVKDKIPSKPLDGVEFVFNRELSREASRELEAELTKAFEAA